jgi:hypothetical protein
VVQVHELKLPWLNYTGLCIAKECSIYKLIYILRPVYKLTIHNGPRIYLTWDPRISYTEAKTLNRRDIPNGTQNQTQNLNSNFGRTNFGLLESNFIIHSCPISQAVNSCRLRLQINQEMNHIIELYLAPKASLYQPIIKTLAEQQDGWLKSD